MDIKQDKRIQKWFGMRNFAEGTEVTYLQYMQRFCDCVGKSPTELIDEAIAEIKQGVWVSDRKTVDYFIQFKKLIKERELSPKAAAVAIACVKSFYKTFDIQLSASIGQTKRPSVRRENMTFITRDDVIKLITNANSLRDKAIILTMATSGMARKEIINLRIRDITIEKTGDNSEIGIVSVRREKTKTDYTTFISPETVLAIKNYLDGRNRNKTLRVRGQNDFVFVTYDNGTKIKDITFTFIFRTLAHQLGYINTNGGIKSKKFQIITKSHALRKLFSSTLEGAGVPKNKVDFLIGHKQNINDQAYFPQDIQALKQLYIKYLPFITFEKVIEIKSLDTEDAKKLEKLSMENESLKSKLTELNKNAAVDKEQMQAQIDEMQRRMKFIQDALAAKGVK